MTMTRLQAVSMIAFTTLVLLASTVSSIRGHTSTTVNSPAFFNKNFNKKSPAFLLITRLPRAGGGGGVDGHDDSEQQEKQYGRIHNDLFRLTPEQIETFHREGCVTIPNVLTEEEVQELQIIFDRFTSGDIKVPGKDFCDMSKPYGIPMEEWSIVNCMLPTRYYPPLRGNIYERLTESMAQQLYPNNDAKGGMIKDYDQLLNKRPGKTDAVFAWHQDMAYWPGSKALGVTTTDTCTFSLAIDDSLPENGCLRYVVGSGVTKTLREHKPLVGDGGRDEGHALCAHVDESGDVIRLAPAKRGSITIHDEWVVHGSGGNTCKDKQRRTYVVAYRAKEIVQAEREIGFTHSHNDQVNWDTFQDGESHRVSAGADKDDNNGEDDKSNNKQ